VDLLMTKRLAATQVNVQGIGRGEDDQRGENPDGERGQRLS